MSDYPPQATPRAWARADELGVDMGYVEAADGMVIQSADVEAYVYGTRSPQPVYASAAPWGSGDPIGWAIATGRLMPRDRPQWTANLANDPAGAARTLAILTPGAPGTRIAASAGYGGYSRPSAPVPDEYAALYGDDDLDRDIARLSPPGRGQRVAAAAGRPDAAYRELYGDGDLDQAIERLTPPRPGEYRPTASPVAAAAANVTANVYGPPATSWANFVEEMRAGHPQLVAEAEAGDIPAPELFPGGGDYPIATASGLPAEAVGEVMPWRARLAIAADPNQARAYQMLQDYAGADAGTEDDARLTLARHPVVNAHIREVHAWLAVGGMSPELRGQRAQQAMVRASAGDVDEDGLTDQEYAALFGPRG